MSQREREIWEACDDLLAMGKKPREITGEAIGHRLRELGYKAGSLTYRYQYRDSWMATRGLSREEEEVSTKPSSLIERSAAIFSKTLEEEIRKEYEAKYQAAQAEIERLTQTIQENAQTIELLSSEKQTLTTENLQLTESLAQQQRHCDDLSHQLTIAKTQTTDYAQQLQAAKAHFQQQMDYLEANVNQRYQDFARQSQAREAQYQQTEAILKEHNEQQRHHFMLELDSVRTEHQKLTETLNQQLQKTRQVEMQLQAATAEVKSARDFEQLLRQQQAHTVEQLQAFHQVFDTREEQLLAAISVEHVKQQRQLKQEHQQLQEVLKKWSQPLKTKKGIRHEA